ncbi:ankyrin repeat domain-containing protein [Rhodopirellula halodulae]|uniref:ankyrin repeat domain-containing protein n=1 Tax=Rhodopirellula halodulae TaxID=2894198 RepID=UPI001E3B8EA6|nr:ankyrin repeat domain-containing protein [Rhodopirellula sp. JC737]MCC9658299.1 ankyrin repeat domain-containing protein [Rhodopirellula sp. JC737]
MLLSILLAASALLSPLQFDKTVQNASAAIQADRAVARTVVHPASPSTATLKRRLRGVNPHWLTHSPDLLVLDRVAADIDETQLLKLHFGLVIDELQNADVSHLTDAQLRERRANIERLIAYMEAGQFPRNIYSCKRTPVFIDLWGTHCAVGHLIAKSGHAKLARLINQQHCLDVIGDIKTDGVLDWQLASGFSVQELAKIQPHYHFMRNSQGIQYPAEIEDLILGDSSKLVEGIEAGRIDVNARCGGKTLLHIAAACGDLELVQKLIGLGAEIDALSQAGSETKLVIGQGHCKVVVRWDEPTLVTKQNHRVAAGRSCETPNGIYLVNVLRDSEGGVEGKNALYFATVESSNKGPFRNYWSITVAPPHTPGLRKPSLDKKVEHPLQALKERRAEVAKWLTQNGLKTEGLE